MRLVPATNALLIATVDLECDPAGERELPGTGLAPITAATGML